MYTLIETVYDLVNDVYTAFKRVERERSLSPREQSLLRQIKDSRTRTASIANIYEQASLRAFNQ